MFVSMDNFSLGIQVVIQIAYKVVRLPGKLRSQSEYV